MSSAIEKSSCCDKTTCCGCVHDTAHSADASVALKEVVREKYGEAAKRAASGQKSSCGCGTSCGCDGQDSRDPITSGL